jgi:hypothetical protein
VAACPNPPTTATVGGLQQYFIVRINDETDAEIITKSTDQTTSNKG